MQIIHLVFSKLYTFFSISVWMIPAGRLVMKRNCTFPWNRGERKYIFIGRYTGRNIKTEDGNLEVREELVEIH